MKRSAVSKQEHRERGRTAVQARTELVGRFDEAAMLARFDSAQNTATPARMGVIAERTVRRPPAGTRAFES